ncbi:MAG: hypothetical protein ABSG93_01470 [Solirubrobacteraceae bacterium]|jgi:hypothetical protein
MSEENLLVVNSLLRVSMRFGEFSTDVYWARRDIEFVIVDGPEPGRWRGHDGLMDATIVWLRTWEEEHFEVDALSELDDERVLALVCITHRRRPKTGPFEISHSKGACLFHFRGRKVKKVVVYFDRERGLADLGLQDSDSPDRQALKSAKQQAARIDRLRGNR